MEFIVNLPLVGINDGTDFKGNTYQVNVSTAMKILQNENVLQQFFPCGVCAMSDSWLPFVASPSNMKQIALKNNVVITTGLGDTLQALSFGEISALQKLIIYNMYFCGDPNLPYLLEHVTIHINRNNLQKHLKMNCRTHIAIHLWNQTPDSGKVLEDLESFFGSNLNHKKNLKLIMIQVDIPDYIHSKL